MSFPNPQVTESLSGAEIAQAVALLCDPQVEQELKGAFLTNLNQRGETAEELAGFADELLQQAVQIPIERDPAAPLVELCGTGGDKAGLLNISTAAMFVVAGAGVRVAKHGSRAVTSRCGSADVLEALGVNLHVQPSKVSEILSRVGSVFLLASAFHPVMALIAPVRQMLAAQGQRTIFNLLGPLLNPVKPEYQLTGVYQEHMLPQYAEAMGLLGRRKAWAVHGKSPAGLQGNAGDSGEVGGIDELTVTGLSRVVSVNDGVMDFFELDPETLGITIATSYDELRGGDAGENAARIVKLLSGEERSAARDMILLNAAAAIHLAGRAETLLEGLAKAEASINSGKAFTCLKALQALQQTS